MGGWWCRDRERGRDRESQAESLLSLGLDLLSRNQELDALDA